MKEKESRSIASRKSTRTLVAREASVRDAGMASLAWRKRSPIEVWDIMGSWGGRGERAGPSSPRNYRDLSLPDCESTLACRVLPAHLHRAHGRAPRPLTDPFDHRLDDPTGAFEHCLDPPICKIADPAGGAHAPRPASRLRTEEHALDQPGDEDVGTDRRHRRLVVEDWFDVPGRLVLLGWPDVAGRLDCRGGLGRARGPWVHSPWVHSPWVHSPWVHSPWVHSPWVHGLGVEDGVCGLPGCLLVLPLLAGHEDVAGLRALRHADDPPLLEQVHQPARPGETDLERALEHRRRAELRPHDELHRLAEQFLVLVALRAVRPLGSLADDALDVVHVALPAAPADDRLDLALGHPGALDPPGAGGACVLVEEVAVADEPVGTALVEDHPAVGVAGGGKCHPGGDVGLDHTGHDVDGGPLGCNHEVDSDRPCHLGDTANALLDIPRRHHHEVGQLVD